MRRIFKEVSLRATHYYKVNGKRRQISKKFFQTINPFNKLITGEIKTRDRILYELEIERSAWLLKMKASHPNS